MLLADARVLVTGAASGLGAALTERLRASGARVLATDVAEPAGDDQLRLDVTSDADWASAVAHVEARLRAAGLLPVR